MATLAPSQAIPMRIPSWSRSVGAIVAATLTAGLALGLLLVGAALPLRDGAVRTPLLVLALVAGAGIPVAAHLGWIRLDAALSDEPAREAVLFISARAVIEGSLLVAVLMVAGSGVHLDASNLNVTLVGPRVLAPILSGIGFIAFVWAVGLFVFGLIAVPLVAPVVVLWRLIVRSLLLRPAPAGSEPG